MRPYPLQWPKNVARAKTRVPSRYKVTLEQAHSELLTAAKKISAKEVIVSSNLLPFQGQPKDPGVAVWFQRKGVQLCLAVDQYLTVRENMRDIGLFIAALADLESRGCYLAEQVFQAFATEALPAPKDHWGILGVPPGSSTDVINAQYRKLAKQRHPDVGGSTEAMAELNEAHGKCLKEVK